MPRLTFDFRSSLFAVLDGTASFVRPGESESLGPAANAWASMALPIRNGAVDAGHDGIPGLVYAVCERLRIRRQGDVEQSVAALAVVHQLTGHEIGIGRATIDLNDHALLRVLVLTPSGAPASGRVVTVLRDSISYQGTVGDDGRVVFLASHGTNVVTANGDRAILEITGDEISVELRLSH